MTRENFDLAAFAKDVHYNAREHGWWDEERSEAEVRALIHSEWSEALEEARAGRPLVWKECLNTNAPCLKEDCSDYWNGKCEMGVLYKKPEGVAIELMDGCIRILDCLMNRDGNMYEVKDVRKLEEDSCYAMCADVAPSESIEKSVTMMSAAEVVDLLHYTTSFDRANEKRGLLLYAFGIACAWVRAQGLDPVELLIEKHEYNKSRPYKHGKKF